MINMPHYSSKANKAEDYQKLFWLSFADNCLSDWHHLWFRPWLGPFGSKKKHNTLAKTAVLLSPAGESQQITEDRLGSKLVGV